MDVFEFLRYNAQESSTKLRKQMERSSGDGEDAAQPDPVETNSLIEDHKPSSSSSPTGHNVKFFANAPHDKIPTVKSLTPYRIETTPRSESQLRGLHSVPGRVKQENVTNVSTKSRRGSTSSQQSSNAQISLSSVVNISNQKIVKSSTISSKVFNLVRTLPKDAVFSPVDSELLNAPPSYLECKNKIEMSPKPDGMPMSKHASVKYLLLSRKTFDEPQFVPYEPYRACTSPILCSTPHKKSIKKDLALLSQPQLPEVFASSVGQKSNQSKTRAPLDIAVVDFEAERVQWQQQVKELQGKCEASQQLLSRCQREKNTLEDQLNVQAQVNGELKKLLVASVGEDVQGRMHCLTEDKARMATMIRRYSEKLDRDYEERERMTILCDVWKSKFLASSVLVEELGSWKASLLRWTAEASEAITVLLDELLLVRSHTRRAYKLLGELVGAFDPLHAGPDSHVAGLGADGASASIAVAAQAQALHQRLLGPLVAPPPAFELPHEEKTPGEKMAEQVLERRSNCVVYPGYLGQSGSLAFHPTSCLLPSHTTINCCSHCNGDIQLV
ncbi:hypothetical protein FHG87_002869 [Trinorchestia longiramus]|nr:hypothetical protein FHG87_002869 [Trinorchestia longiramus]